jgi:hypothetical protein
METKKFPSDLFISKKLIIKPHENIDAKIPQVLRLLKQIIS